MKKKVGALLMAGVMMFSLTACGNDKSKKYSKYVELGEYKGIEYTLDVTEVTDEEIDSQVNSLLESNTEAEEITDRPVEEGDVVNIDFVGTKDGTPFDGGTAEGTELEIGSGTFIDGFEDGLIGHEIGEEVSLDLTFPDDYSSEELAGEDVNFAVTINSISVNHVPELTDSLIAELTEYDTIDAYRDSIRKNLEESNESYAKSQAEADVFNKVVENAKITGYDQSEVNDLIDQEFDSFKETAESYASYGYSYEDVLAANGYSSEQELKEGITEYVKSYLNQVMVLYCIAKEEGIDVTSDEIKDLVNEYMEMYSLESEDEVYEYFGEDNLELYVLSEKVREFLMDNAVQTTSADNEDETDAASSSQE